MQVILSLETSTDACSVAVHDQGVMLASKELREPNAHAGRLAVMIKDLFQSVTLSMDSLVAVAVSSGPGSYTGLRIGTSTAKGICYALGRPLLSVDSLSVMAHEASPMAADAMLCPLIDARRMEVYCRIFDARQNPVGPIEAIVVDRNSFSTVLQHNKVCFFGSGMPKTRELLNHPAASFIEDIIPTASALGKLAWERFQNRQFENLSAYEPIYLKEFEVKKSKKIQNVLNN